MVLRTELAYSTRCSLLGRPPWPTLDAEEAAPTETSEIKRHKCINILHTITFKTVAEFWTMKSIAASFNSSAACISALIAASQTVSIRRFSFRTRTASSWKRKRCKYIPTPPYLQLSDLKTISHCDQLEWLKERITLNSDQVKTIDRMRGDFPVYM